jgi:iron complex outermembrane receptor protein
VNGDAAASATLGNLRGGWRVPFGKWDLTMLGRIDNVTDKRYIGSIIVNDGNARFFEPAPGRTWLVAAQVRYRFR